MSRILQSITEISGNYDAMFVDLWGCYHNGVRPHDAAVRALQAYRRDGGRVILLTNAPRPAHYVKDFLDRMGSPEDSYDGIMSSGSACQRAMASGAYGSAFHYVGPDRDRHMLGDIGLEDRALDDADALLCTGLPDDRLDPRRTHADAVEDWLGRGLPMLCANPDIVVDRGDERLWCAGALAQFYEEKGGKVIWFGKPHGPTYDQTFSLLAEVSGHAIGKDRVLAIGDGIRTDVKGGLDYGLDTVFITGGLSAAEIGGDVDHPDPEGVARYLADAGLQPHYSMGRLR